MMEIRAEYKERFDAEEQRVRPRFYQERHGRAVEDVTHFTCKRKHTRMLNLPDHSEHIFKHAYRFAHRGERWNFYE